MTTTIQMLVFPYAQCQNVNEPSPSCCPTQFRVSSSSGSFLFVAYNARSSWNSCSEYIHYSQQGKINCELAADRFFQISLMLWVEHINSLQSLKNLSKPFCPTKDTRRFNSREQSRQRTGWASRSKRQPNFQHQPRNTYAIYVKWGNC